MFKNFNIEKIQDITNDVELLIINKSKYTNINTIHQVIDDFMINLDQTGDYDIGDIYSLYLGSSHDVTEFSIIFKHHYGIETIIMKIKTHTKNKKIIKLHIYGMDDFSPELMQIKYD